MADVQDQNAQRGGGWRGARGRGQDRGRGRGRGRGQGKGQRRSDYRGDTRSRNYSGVENQQRAEYDLSRGNEGSEINETVVPGRERGTEGIRGIGAPRQNIAYGYSKEGVGDGPNYSDPDRNSEIPRSFPREVLSDQSTELSQQLDKTLQLNSSDTQNEESEADVAASIDPSTVARVADAVEQFNQPRIENSTRERQSTEVTQREEIGRERENEFQKTLDALARPLADLSTRTATEHSRATFEIIQEWTLQKSRFFSWGRVFKVKWHQPCGQDISPLFNKDSASQTTSQTADPSENGVFTKYLRFMVFSEHNSHAICLPIQSYNKSGCLKKGLKESEIRQHAVIYDHTLPEPWNHENEPIHIMRDAIKVHLVPHQQLNRWSRIRFDQPTVVNHNLLVLEVGWVDKGYQRDIRAYVTEALTPRNFRARAAAGVECEANSQALVGAGWQ